MNEKGKIPPNERDVPSVTFDPLGYYISIDPGWEGMAQDVGAGNEVLYDGAIVLDHDKDGRVLSVEIDLSLLKHLRLGV